MTVCLTAYYHVWAAGNWQEPLKEFLETLDVSAFDGPLYVGIVGNFNQRAEVQRAIRRDCEFVISPDGWEQVTLDAVRANANYSEGAVLYAHTKGAYQASAETSRVRRILLDNVVRRWKENLVPLTTHDAIGYQWTTSAEGFQGRAFFYGNWWIANCSYLRKLPICSRLDRFRAEGWLGLQDPKVYDLARDRITYDSIRWEPVKDTDVCWSR